MKPASSLFAKILSWFFFNMLLVALALAVFFAFQPQIDLRALVFGKQGASRLRAAGMLLVHDLGQTRQADWPQLMARHARIHGIDFSVVLEDGSHFSSTTYRLPEKILTAARNMLRRRPPVDLKHPPYRIDVPLQPHPGISGREANTRTIGKEPPIPGGRPWKRPYLVMRTKNPARYWAAAKVQLPATANRRPASAVLLAVSDSWTGNGFFFDPVPWLMVALAVIIISVLFWIPMVRHITRPLARMTRATETIADGRFDVAIHEARADEIGRLANAINHMTSRLSAFVTGQKRFLGDVAHELGSPLARIQFGLGALEQRIEKENRQRVKDVIDDVDHLSNLVNELLAFSRADMRSDTVRLEKINLLSVVQTAVKRESVAGVDTVIRVDPEIRVTASAELLTRALANLMRNAAKYAGGTGPVTISAEEKNNAVELQVRDEGPGVPETLHDQLFEPFFRPEASRDRDSGGVGLGLAIVKTCIETCRGTVAARNLQPAGFAVVITLKA